MKEENLNRIIFLIREMMTTGSTAGAPGFSEKSPSKGPTAGFSPAMGITKRKKYASLGPKSRSRWMPKKPTP